MTVIGEFLPVGSITGLDGSGFSGISLAGSIAKFYRVALDGGTATLTALRKVAGTHLNCLPCFLFILNSID